MPAVAFSHEVLAAVFQVRAQRLCVLLWQRGQPPFRHRWSLPGGSLGERERLGASIARHLASKVDVAELAHLEQLETRSDPKRDPRGRVLGTAYLGLVPADQRPQLPPDTAWHPAEALPRTAFDHGSIVESGRGRRRAQRSFTSIAPWPRRRSPSPSCAAFTRPRSAMRFPRPTCNGCCCDAVSSRPRANAALPARPEDVQPRGSASPAARSG